MEEKIAKDNVNTQSQTKNANMDNTQQKNNDNVPRNIPEQKTGDEDGLMKDQDEGKDFVFVPDKAKKGGSKNPGEECSTDEEPPRAQTLEEAVRAAIKECKERVKEEAPDNSKAASSLEKDVADEKGAKETSHGGKRRRNKPAASPADIVERRRAAKWHIVRLLLFIFCQMMIICICSMYAEELYAIVDGFEAAVSGFFGIDQSSELLTVIYMLGAVVQLYLAYLLHRRIRRP